MSTASAIYKMDRSKTAKTHAYSVKLQVLRLFTNLMTTIYGGESTQTPAVKYGIHTKQAINGLAQESSLQAGSDRAELSW